MGWGAILNTRCITFRLIDSYIVAALYKNIVFNKVIPRYWNLTGFSLVIGISQGFGLIKKGMGIVTYPVSFSCIACWKVSTCYAAVSFSCIACRYFSKWWLKIFSGGNHPPVLATFDSLPYPIFYFFLFQNDNRGCSLEYL